MEKITEENCKQKLLEYTQSKYADDEFQAAAENCPYDITWLEDNEELIFKELVEWFQLEWKDPKTGKTVVRQFTEDAEMEPWLKAEMLKMEQVRRGKFEIIEEHGDSINAREMDAGNILTILLKASEKKSGFFTKGRILEGRIHPWKDAHWLAGILKTRLTREEQMQRFGLLTPESLMDRFKLDMTDKTESLLIRKDTRMSAMLNKYPSNWVDGICTALKIRGIRLKGDKVKAICETLNSEKLPEIADRLPPESREALAFVLEKGGFVKYSQLNFEDETEYFWNEYPLKTTLGSLRYHGLLYVGKMALGSSGRMYKVALIPTELRERLQGILQNTMS